MNVDTTMNVGTIAHNNTMAARVTDDERTRIIELCQQGETCRNIARIVGRSSTTISTIARNAGHKFGQTNAARAREARSSYTAERRALQASRIADEIDRLLTDMRSPATAFNFGGSDNTYNEVVLPEPTNADKRALMQAVRDAMRTVLDIDRHDNKADQGASDVDRYLRDLIGDTVQAVVE